MCFEVSKGLQFEKIVGIFWENPGFTPQKNSKNFRKK